jgi:ABC-2 type transport system ATP-binding protein
MAIISVHDLVKRYGDFTAVNGLSFEVNKGEIFGLLGPNGAGKTTTLEIIETLRSKTSGTVLVDGMNLDTHPQEIKKIIGVQLQAAGFYPNLNLKELIALFAGLYNVKTDPIALLKSVDLEDKARSKFKELSGGQKQRFSIATTIINKPKIIFLDEPTSGTTVVITTHYMDEAEELCDRVAIIDSGKIVSLDTPDKLIDDLIAGGFERKKKVKEANLEDVFINLTGKELREG